MEIPVDDLDDLSSSSESSKEEGHSAASMTTQFLQVARYWLQDHCTCGCGGNDGEKLSMLGPDMRPGRLGDLNPSVPPTAFP